MVSEKKGSEKKMVELAEDDPDSVICPKCHEKTDHLIKHGKANYCVCPHCNQRLGVNCIPEDLYDKFVIEQQVQVKPLRGKEELIKKEPEAGIFKRMRTPDELLEEVLNDFSVSAKGKKILLGRSKTTGGLKPDEVMELLLKISGTGISDDYTAEFIKDDYASKIKKEKELAIKNDYPITNEFYNQFEPWGTASQQLPQQNPGAPNTPQYPTQQLLLHNPQNPQQPIPYYPSQSSSAEEERKLRKEERDEERRMRKEERDEERREDRHQAQLKQDEVRLRDEKSEKLRKEEREEERRREEKAEKLRKEEREEERKRDDKAEKLRKEERDEDRKREEKKDESKVTQAKSDIAMFELKMKEERELRKEEKKEFEDRRREEKKEFEDRRREDKEGFERRITDMTNSPSGYKDDTVRLMAEGMHKLSDVVKNKSPIKDTAKVFMDLEDGPMKKGKFKSEKKIDADVLPEEIIDENYIEEYDDLGAEE